MLQGLDDDGRARALDALRASLEAHHTAQGVAYRSAAWLITATRRVAQRAIGQSGRYLDLA